ncbi:MAG: hypothetical protein HYY17_03075 [Planctomycetes bacterium]|nr:hypothetical protein [Planctomycetota bacterium]
MVNFTSHEAYKDQTCIVEPAEFDQLKRRSCIETGNPILRPASEFKRLVDSGLLRMLPSITPALLEKIRRGAATTDRIALEHQELLKDQGVI